MKEITENLPNDTRNFGEEILAIASTYNRYHYIRLLGAIYYYHYHDYQHPSNIQRVLFNYVLSFRSTKACILIFDFLNHLAIQNIFILSVGEL